MKIKDNAVTEIKLFEYKSLRSLSEGGFYCLLSVVVVNFSSIDLVHAQNK